MDSSSSSGIVSEDVDCPAVANVPAAPAVEHLHHRGLAGPVGAQQAEADALLDLETQVADGAHAAERLVDMLNAYDLHDPITGYSLFGRQRPDPPRPCTHRPPSIGPRLSPYFTHPSPERHWEQQNAACPRRQEAAAFPQKRQDIASRFPRPGVSDRLPAADYSRCPGMILDDVERRCDAAPGPHVPPRCDRQVRNYCLHGHFHRRLRHNDGAVELHFGDLHRVGLRRVLDGLEDHLVRGVRLGLVGDRRTSGQP